MTMIGHNGGPAFPHFDTGEAGMRPSLSMRDWFAGQALATAYAQSEQSPDNTAKWAYQVADAMLAARGGNHE